MFSCDEVAQAKISWAMYFQDMTIVAQYTRHSSTHFYVTPKSTHDSDRLPLVFALSLVTALDTNICSVQKEEPREKWYSCINVFCQSSCIVYCIWATMLRPQERFILDQLGNCLALSVTNMCPTAYMKKKIKQILSVRMTQNFRRSLSWIKVQEVPQRIQYCHAL
jgi:hypothetical protein